MPKANPRERLDVINENDEPISQATRREIHEERLLHRAVHILLTHEGQLLLQRRSREKRTFPGLWTSTASGHVPAGDTPRQAANQELAEEVGIHNLALTHQGTLRIDALEAGERELVHLFTGTYDGPVDPDPHEVKETQWVPLAQVDEWLDTDPGRFADTFLPVYETLRETLQAPTSGGD